jgi:large subunit ribosomal protein L21
MYAVVSTGGKQLKVEEGTEAVVEKLNASIGDTVALDVLFVADGDDIIVDADALQSAKVNAEVVEHFKGEKQIVFKFKRRKGYKRLKGHRQDQTRIKVTGIDADAAKKAAKRPAKKVKAEEKKPAPAKKAEKAPESAEAKAKEAAKKAETKVKAEVEKVEAKVEAEVEKAKAKVEAKPEKKAEKKPEKAEKKPEKAEKKPEAKDEAVLCAATKANGDPCTNKAKEGSEYCGVHAKKYDK